MPVQINGKAYYRTSEVCRKSGISRATLFRWLKTGILERSYKDRRGWRIFNEDDLNKIRMEAGRVEVEFIAPRLAGQNHDTAEADNWT